MQRALWSSQRRQPGSPHQNMALLSHIEGTVDAQRLADAFHQVVAGSDVLRTTIVDSPDGPAVRLRKQPDRTELTPLDRPAALRWARERVQNPLDLRRAGYDSVIIEHPDGTCSWYLNLHHVITDATASAAVFEATAATYAGDRPAIPSYYDWSAGLGSELSPRAERARTHWRSRRSAPRIGALYRPAGSPDSSSVRLEPEIPEALEAAIEDRLAADYAGLSDDLTWTSFLLTATATYLHRITGAVEMALGLPVHNRSGLDQFLLGPVMEVFPVDVTIEANDTFRTLHKRVARAAMSTIRHAQPGTAPAANDVETVVNVIPRGRIDRFGDLEVTTEWVHAGATDPSHLLRVQLTTYAGERPSLVLDINRAVADDEQMRRAPHHLVAVLEQMTADPDAGIGAQPVITADEKVELSRWGDRRADTLETPLLPGRLFDALTRHPRTVVRGERTLTGPELNAEIARVGSWLRSTHGVGRCTRVAIAMPRTTEAVVAVLATWWAGGSYVPIDPAQPSARQRDLIYRAGCSVVVTELPDTEVPPDFGPAIVDDDDEAYLLFTSGSTGEPKGVPITHRGVSDYLEFARSHYLKPGEAPVVPLFSALTFDLTVTSLFLPLLAGGTLVVVPEDGLPGLRRIADDRTITWAKATPSHLDLLVRMLPEDHRLGTLVVGGEAFGSRLAARLRDHRADLRIFNEYGPTEAVVGCMIHEASATEPWADVPIGRPAPGVELRILDIHDQPVPIGSPGELHISHRGVTAGHLGASTDDAGPFVELDGRRFYRSGDLVRFVAPGVLTYLGRVDEQIKVGGIRLDPTEVERHIESHPSVARAAVRMWSPSWRPPAHHCSRCGLPGNVPGVRFDEEGVCHVCHQYEQIKDHATAYFKNHDDLVAERDRARAERTGRYDCLHLLSGGKDSTYALYRLVELGFEVYAVTLDNGFISEGAKANVRKSVADLGVDHEFLTADAMNEIFADSLQRHSNVCHGCYKTIYTTATTRAAELGIPMIVTGLSRGQLFETRLIPQQFTGDRFDPDAIDRAVLQARRVYHRVDDGPNRLLDTSVFDDEHIFDTIRYVDFYRYVDVELSEMYRFLDTEAPWLRPDDTGRSTNCLINAAGIYTHQLEQGYHNYAEPYAWDVRLGHKTRDEAIAELDDRLHIDDVKAMLAEVGYEPHRREVFTAWVEVAAEAAEPTPAELRAWLSSRVPGHAVPSAYVLVEQLPMTANGKLDTSSLPGPSRVHRTGSDLHVGATSDIEASIIAVWEKILGLEPIGVTDDFFELGGDSLAALQSIVELSDALGRTLREELIFGHRTPRALASVVDAEAGEDTPRDSDSDRGGPGPLPAGAASMVFDWLNDPGSTENNVGRAYLIDGRLDPVTVESAFHRLIERHSPLHTSLLEPRHTLDVERAGRFEVGELADPRAFDAFAQERFLEPFDLEHGPLVRALLIPLTTGQTGLMIATHHAVIDEAGFDALFADLAALTEGRTETLEFSYAAMAELMTSRADLPEDRTFWLNPVRSSEIASPRWAPIPAGGADGYLDRPATFSVDQLNALGVGRAATALAAVNRIVRRRADGDRIEVGMAASVRPAAARGLVGHALNLIPVVTEVDPSEPVATSARQAESTLRAALAHRQYPLASIIADRRRAGRSAPQLRVMLAYGELAPVEIAGHRGEHRVLPPDRAAADVTFFVQVRGDRVNLGVEYSGAVLDAAGASALLDEFAKELAGTPVGGIGATVTDRAEQRALDAVVTEAARRSPEAVAVQAGGTSITYRELVDRADSLAARLQALGIGRGGFVGVVAARRPETVPAILGVLRAGAAYVPIDPDYPADRIAHLVTDSGITAVLCAGDAPALPDSVQIIDVAGVETGAPFPVADRHPDDPAYAIYTSGSTGRPKGVVVSHANIVYSTTVRTDVYGHDPARFLLLSSFAFDSSMVGLWWTLCTGGHLILPDEGHHTDVHHLAELVETARITHLLAIPSLYGVVLDEVAVGSLASLDTVIVAGEACPSGLVVEHFEALPGTELHNEYGPSEATVWSHHHRFDRRFAVSQPVPIGHPIPGSSGLVLDGDLAPVAAGETGELFIGGPGVCLGYLGRPDLTDERFVAVPGHGDERYYRTGDLVRALPDGALEFVGRVDDQVKLRGIRIELGEIESALQSNGLVRAAAAGVVDTPNGPRLAAWYVGTVPPDELTAQLRSILPVSMVPSFLTQLPAMPLTPNGKLDRQSLPAPKTGTRTENRDSARSEQNPLRAAIADVWSEVLAVANVGADDNYFDLGGDSILSIRIVSALRRRGILVKPRDLFEHPTVAQLSTVATSSTGAAATTPRLVGPVPLLPMQQWFFDQGFVDPDHWNQSMWFAASRPLDRAVLEQALQHVIDHHDALRARFGRAGTGWTQDIAEEAPPATVQELRNLNDASVAAVAESIEASLDIARGELVAAAIFRDRSGPDRLLLTIHHLAVDGVSWGPIIEDLTAAYRAIETDRPVELPRRTSSIADWARAVAELPVHPHWAALAERLPEPAPGRHGEDEAEHREVSLDVPGHGDVLDRLLAAVGRAHREVFGWNRLTATLEGHGRAEEIGTGLDLSRTVGWFTAMYPIDVGVTGEAGNRAGAPNGGVGALAAVDRMPRLVVNYLGRIDQAVAGTELLTPVSGILAAYGAANHRAHDLGILAQIVGGRLHVRWDFVPDRYPPERIDQVIDAFTRSFARSFDLVELSATDLDTIAGLLDEV